MRALLAAVVACTFAGLLYLSLDSGVFRPPAERVVSLALLGLAAIFAGGAWGASMGGYPRRVPFFAGLAAGVAGYAVARLLL